MIEREPTLLHVRRQLGQAFVDRRPFAEHLEPGGRAGAQALFEVRGARITNILDEVRVDVRHLIGEPEITGIGE